MDLTTHTLIEIRNMLAQRDVSAVDAVQACLDRIEATEPQLHAFVNLTADQALARARQLDDAGPDPEKPLWGVPISVKDVMAVQGAPCTCSSRMLENFSPFYDAECVARLLDAGAIVLGKTNMDEFAMGSSTENSAFGPTMNPWDMSRVPGGSSGGAAASVAAGQCFGGLGTDTGGSIRQPASLCGCVGLKPTYGRVSRYGLVAYGSSLDQAGPLTRTVEDAALLLQTMAGHDPKDSTCSQEPVPDYMAALHARQELSGVTIGLPAEYWGAGADPEVLDALRAAVDTARSLGAAVVDVSLPHTDYAVAAYYIVVMAEASSNLARFDGVRYGLRDKDAAELIDMYVRSRTQGFGDEVQRRIMMGAYVLSAGYYDAYYRKAAKVRRLILQDFQNALNECDVIAGPVSPVTAWKLGELTADPLQMYLMDIYTLSLNMAGLPGISIPAGLGEASGLPVGLQLISKAFSEETLLSVANTLHKTMPELGEPQGISHIR